MQKYSNYLLPLYIRMIFILNVSLIVNFYIGWHVWKTCSLSNDVRTLNRLYPKIDNLDHFPLKVLLQIFDALGDNDFVRLIEVSSWFEGIAKMALNERYGKQYFKFDDTTYHHYEDFIQLVGSEIKSIEELERTQIHVYWKDLPAQALRIWNFGAMIQTVLPRNYLNYQSSVI